MKEKEKLIDLLVAHSKDTGADMQKYIDELMSLDVVFCSECRYWTGEKCKRFSYAPWAYCYTKAGDYCSGGDRI